MSKLTQIVAAMPERLSISHVASASHSTVEYKPTSKPFAAVRPHLAPIPKAPGNKLYLYLPCRVALFSYGAAFKFGIYLVFHSSEKNTK